MKLNYNFPNFDEIKVDDHDKSAIESSSSEVLHDIHLQYSIYYILHYILHYYKLLDTFSSEGYYIILMLILLLHVFSTILIK